jgi:hypothetical protein
MKIHVVIPENSPLSSTYEGPAPTQEQEMVELRKLTVAMGKEAIIAQYLDGGRSYGAAVAGWDTLVQQRKDDIAELLGKRGRTADTALLLLGNTGTVVTPSEYSEMNR